MKKSLVYIMFMLLFALVSCGTQEFPVENIETPVVQNPVSQEVQNISVEEPILSEITFEDDNFIVQGGELYFKKKDKVEYKYVKHSDSEGAYARWDIVDSLISDTYKWYNLNSDESYTVTMYGTWIILQKIDIDDVWNFKTILVSDAYNLDEYKKYYKEEYLDPINDENWNSWYIEYIWWEDDNNYYKIKEKKYSCLWDTFSCSWETELEIIKK